MFNLARIKARFKAEVREAKKFFNRQEMKKEFVSTTETIRTTAPKPKRSPRLRKPLGIKTHNRQGRPKHPLHSDHFQGFMPLRRIAGRTDFSKSAEIHRARVVGRMKTRQESRRITLKAA